MATFGLYPAWQRYAPYLASYQRDFLKCLIVKILPTLGDLAPGQGSFKRTSMFCPMTEDASVKNSIVLGRFAHDHVLFLLWYIILLFVFLCVC